MSKVFFTLQGWHLSSVKDELLLGNALFKFLVLAEVESTVAHQDEEGHGACCHDRPAEEDHILVKTFFQLVNARLSR